MKRIAAVALASATLWSPARAESIDERVRIALELNLLGFQSFHTSGGQDSTSAGVRFPSLGFAAGYAPTDRLYLGARALRELGSEGATGKGRFWSMYALEAAYVAPGEMVRPFVGAVLGRSSLDARIGGYGVAKMWLGGVDAGMRIFASSEVSVDPRLSFFYESGETDALEPASRVSVVLSMCVSGWFGGTAPSRDPEEWHRPPPKYEVVPPPAD